MNNIEQNYKIKKVNNLINELSSNPNPQDLNLKESFNIMIYGFGIDGVGDRTINLLLNNLEMFNKSKLEKIIATSRRPKESEEADKKKNIIKNYFEKYRYSTRLYSDPSSQKPSIEYCFTDEAHQHINNIDLIVVTASLDGDILDKLNVPGSGVTSENFRILMSQRNMPIIDDIKELVKNGYNGHIHIVSNLPEILAYKLAIESNLNPHQITGMSQLDNQRMIQYLITHFKENKINVNRMEAFGIGYHGDILPIRSHIILNPFTDQERYIDNLPDETIVHIRELVKCHGGDVQKINKKLRNEILEKKIKKFIPNMEELKKISFPSPDETAEAIVNFILPYSKGGGELIIPSTYYSHELTQGKGGLYVHMPTYLINTINTGLALPNKTLIDKITYEKDKEEIYIILDTLRQSTYHTLYPHEKPKILKLKTEFETDAYTPGKKRIEKKQDIKKNNIFDKLHIYYNTTDENRRIIRKNLGTNENEFQFNLRVNNNDSFNDRLSINKIIPYNKRLYILAKYEKYEKKIFSSYILEYELDSTNPGLIKPSNILNLKDNENEIKIKNGLNNTLTKINGLHYFLIDNNDKTKILKFDPSKFIYDIITSENQIQDLIHIVPIEEKFIGFTHNTFYRFKNCKYFEMINQVDNREIFQVKTLPHHELILFSDYNQNNITLFKINSPNKLTTFDGGPNFNISQKNDIITFAYQLKNKLFYEQYSSVDQLIDSNPIISLNSNGFGNIEKILLPTQDSIIVYSEKENKKYVHKLALDENKLVRINEGLEIKNIRFNISECDL